MCSDAAGGFSLRRRDFQVDGGGGEERPGGEAPARPTRALTDGCVGAG